MEIDITGLYNGISSEDFCFMQTHSITLGRNIPNSGTVTRQMWNQFLKDEVCSLLDFATITEGVWIYKGDLEECMTISITVDERTAGADRMIKNLHEVGQRYKTQFRQDCVLYSTTSLHDLVFT